MPKRRPNNEVRAKAIARLAVERASIPEGGRDFLYHLGGKASRHTQSSISEASLTVKHAKRFSMKVGTINAKMEFVSPAKQCQKIERSMARQANLSEVFDKQMQAYRWKELIKAKRNLLPVM